MCSRGKRIVNMLLNQRRDSGNDKNERSIESVLDENQMDVVNEMADLFGSDFCGQDPTDVPENFLLNNNVRNAEINNSCDSISLEECPDLDSDNDKNERSIESVLDENQMDVVNEMADLLDSDFSDQDPTYVPDTVGNVKNNNSCDSFSSCEENPDSSKFEGPRECPPFSEECNSSADRLTVSERKHPVASTSQRGNRWRKANPAKWKHNVAKKNRSLCLPYNIKNKIRDAKAPKSVQCNSCRFKCTENFSEEYRKLLCEIYWKLGDFQRQKDFILANVTSCPPERRRRVKKLCTRKPRIDSKSYYFEKDATKFRVCQKFFLSTLSISADVICNAFTHKGPLGTYNGIDGRGRNSPPNKTSAEMFDFVKRHIESFPKVEAHYCRQSSQRSYLDSKLSIAKMYALYVELCKTEKKKYCSAITYRRIFGNNYNLSFFRPKKDQCALCTKFNEVLGDVKINMQAEYDQHQLRKEECNEAKRIDKEKAATNPNFLSLTFDLQSVLQIPSSDVSPMYYSRKICMYNLTVYEAMVPNNAFCFCWTELNGKRGSSEIGSCLFQYLTKNLPDHVTEVSMFSDTCGGQNRNQHVAALLMYVVQITNLKTLEHKFLESGHSYMEVDSIHSSIEKAKKYVPVYTVQDWLTIFRLARSKRQRNKVSSAYLVNEMKFNSILDLQDLSKRLIKNRTIDENGKTVKWLKIKSLKYEKENWGKIQYKYTHTDEYSTIDAFNSSLIAMPKKLKNLYQKQLPITLAKKKDLVKLCQTNVIPEEFHGWYRNLPTCNKKDTLPEPGADEDTESDSSDE